MTQIVCLSYEPWSAVPTRTQHLLTRLKDARILFFEPASGSAGADGHKVRPGLTVYTMPPLVEIRGSRGILYRRSQERRLRFVEQVLDKNRFNDPLLWVTSPEFFSLADALPRRALVYDCHREWSEFPLRWESDLALACDVVFAASPQLCERLAPCSDNIALLPNGANYRMFSRDTSEIPAALREPGAVFGYLGTLWADLELSPVLECARRCPEHRFVFVGPVENNPRLEKLRRLPNVLFEEHPQAVDLPDYVNRFDVCMDLYRTGEIGSDLIPERLYQYLSSGKPIVSRLWEGQIEHFPDVISGAHTDAEFVRMCENALKEGDSWAKRRRQEYGAAAAWSARAAEVGRILAAIGLY